VEFNGVLKRGYNTIALPAPRCGEASRVPWGVPLTTSGVITGTEIP
jgi:hypothetical protein